MRLKNAANQVTFPRIILALVLAAATGALATTIWTWWDIFKVHGPVGAPISFDSWMYFRAGFIVWLASIVLFSALPWILLHGLGYRTWLAMALAGAALTFVVTLGLHSNAFNLMPHSATSNYSAWDPAGALVLHNRVTAHGWAVAFREACVFGAVGALMGILVWRVAYRKAKAQ